MQPLILASSSPYRRELLSRLQLPFNVLSPDIDETPYTDEQPEQTALRLAQAKACKIAETHPDALIIGCDQVATLDGLQLGKPITHDNAVRQLSLMRGRSVVFHSALCLYNAANQQMQADVVPYTVTFRDLSDQQIENYLRKEQPYQCAGSAKSEGLGIAVIAAMEGNDPNALIGLPLIRLIDMLSHQGVDVI
ncbi:septum formation protein [Methylobacillus rhizosphaerae]|uniref:7-methyl-GTP pyrophosphatase n=1 Tax=Methylobacillus rhizosphaerae TaxID=551994 RepID=A0A238ZNV2_9PROT|nr:Maf family nucleotide pyrophosphatase [Methylobacillus rhizosphaerae]SNR85000.1 septum formation protein [Methylobacillus rhizosphaerae]